jgi:hypothetical protein
MKSSFFARLLNMTSFMTIRSFFKGAVVAESEDGGFTSAGNSDKIIPSSDAARFSNEGR